MKTDTAKSEAKESTIASWDTPTREEHVSVADKFRLEFRTFNLTKDKKRLYVIYEMVRHD